ncbi:hypothetical protein ABT173_28185 [Streptomyces sp. NPDC001795]|uniref:hypothetical protein n=1 Tax=Streptomyces sp. NPDC001795 TaxID=3154525 RepID=UPI003331807B
MAPEYDGADALTAAITGEPLPDAARADAGFMAAHRAALADVALLREQLGIIGEALAGPSAESSPAAVPDTPEPAIAPDRPHLLRPARRPVRRGRTLRVAVGSLAAVAALSTVVWLGWLVAHNGGADSAMSKSSGAADAASKGDARAPGKTSGDGSPPSDPGTALACSRLVVEGTVAEVGPLSDPRTRVVLTVTRSYKPDHGPSRVTFLLDGEARPQPRRGQHVLISIPQGTDGPSLWAVGDERVAANRAWITKALPGARHTACPSEGPK